MTRELEVRLGERSYPIHIGADLSGELTAALETLAAEGRKCAILTDENVAAAQGNLMERLREAGPVMALPAGEKTKSVGFLEEVYDFLAGERMERSSVLAFFAEGKRGFARPGRGREDDA